MDTYRYNSTSSYAQRPAASVRTVDAQALAADWLRAGAVPRGVRGSATGAGSASAGAERRVRAHRRRSNFMRYAADNRAVQILYALTTGPWRFAFYGAVALAVAVSIYFPARDFYAAYRTGDILSRQLEVRETYNKELEAKVDKLLSTEGIEETARKKLGLVMPGEHAVEVIGIDGDGTSSSDSGSSSKGSSASDADDATAGSDADASAKKTNDADDTDDAGSATDAQDNQDAGADAKDKASSAADASKADAADQADATENDSADAATASASSAPSTSAEVEAAERAVAEDAPWYIHVLDAVFFYQGVEGQTVSSTGA